MSAWRPGVFAATPVERRLARPILALLPPIVALILQSILWPLINPYVWFLFYPAVFISSWIGGLGGGLLATAISTVSVLWFFVPPTSSLIKAPGLYFPAGVFFTMGVLFGVFHDRLRKAVTALRETNDTLERLVNEHRVFAALIENSTDFIGIADASGKPVYVNPAGRRMVGMPADYPVEETQIPEYYAPDQRAFASEVIVKAMVERGLWTGETTFRNWQTGEPIPVSDTHFMIRDPETGQLLGMGTVTRDISDIRRAREELQRANLEITQLYEKSRELDELKTGFFAGVSHELRTPLALILGPVERLLRAPETSSAARADLEIIARNARTLLGHVNDLLDIARVDAGRLEPSYANADAAVLARFVADHFTVLAKERDIAFTVEAPAPVMVEVDVEKLKRVLMNLLSNAFKFTPRGGRVRLSVRERGDRFAVEVGDSGPGVPAGKRGQVFERFRRLEDATTQRHGGTGLGLSIVKDFVSLLGGDVQIEDAPEGGALFRLELPCRAPPGASVRPRADETVEAVDIGHGVAALAEPRPGASVAERSRDAGALVLVVEDNREMNAFIAQSLVSDGFRVATAFDGVEAYERALTESPDLVLTDVMMPGAGGEELVLALRERPELSSTPIVVLTAKADDELRVRLLREGVQDYLTKPFSTEELCARVRNHIARRRAEQNSHALRRQVEAVALASLSVSEAVAGLPETSVRAVLDTIALNAQSLTSAEYAAVGIGGDASHPFEPWAFAGISEEQAARIGGPPQPVGLLGLVTRENRTVRLRDMREHETYRGLPPNHPVMTSFLGAPIRYRGQAVGNLYLANKRGAAEFTAQDQRLVEMLAARAGVAVQTARLYAAEGMERAWLQAVVDQMPEGIVLMDVQGKVTAENGSALALAGSKSGERDPFDNPASLDLRTPSGEPLAPDEVPIVKAILKKETTRGQELVARRADGRHVPVLVSAAPVRAANGDMAGATMVLQDITALKVLEQLREEWASIVAHDLQQPINAIVLRADLLLRAGLGDKAKEGLEQVRVAAKRLSRMVRDLMDASQLETNRLHVSLERIELVALLHTILERMPEAAARTTIRAPVGRPLFIRGDAERVEQILANLLSNALKYGAPDTGVSLDLEEVNGSAQVSVTNRGPGIPEDELPQLFERYFRSRAARRSRTKGSGLGLYIAKGLVEAHGGRMWVESRPGETTTFRFSIPLDDPAAGGVPATPEQARPEA